jgi:large subunit ribosomal protein L6
MGYKFSFDVNLHSLILSIGYSHAVTYKVPSNISVKVVKKNQLSLHSVDYRSLMQAIATLKSFKKLDVFKGKGIRIPEEKLLLKEGKKGKK